MIEIQQDIQFFCKELVFGMALLRIFGGGLLNFDTVRRFWIYFALVGFAIGWMYGFNGFASIGTD
ncbi:MAG: hypothetical protein RL329_2461 [Bacteroidota bacterium]|jgi:hypothetical protein